MDQVLLVVQSVGLLQEMEYVLAVVRMENMLVQNIVYYVTKSVMGVPVALN